MSGPSRHDVLIIGGGLIGGTLALALAQGGLRVALVDAADPAVTTDEAFDGRATSIARGSRRLLSAIGVWPGLADLAEPIRDIRVRDGDAPVFLNFDSSELSDAPFGHMVENRHLRRALHAAVIAEKTIDARFSVRLIDSAVEGERVRARFDDGHQATARLLIGADGRQSLVRRQAGIRSIAWSYRQAAIVTSLQHERPHLGVATEHFLPAGPLALLPLQGRRSSLVWTEDRDMAPHFQALKPDRFDAELQRRIGDHLGAVHAVGRRWLHPLGLSNAERYIGPRLALVGDAAHAMHPIAGQGLNVGFRDVAALAELAIEALRLGLDPGAPSLLRRYQRWRRFDALSMLVMTDGLNRLFSTEIAPVRLARRLGLAMVDRSALAKRFFAGRAAAVSGDLPKLIRGQTL